MTSNNGRRQELPRRRKLKCLPVNLITVGFQHIAWFDPISEMNKQNFLKSRFCFLWHRIWHYIFLKWEFLTCLFKSPFQEKLLLHSSQLYLTCSWTLWKCLFKSLFLVNILSHLSHFFSMEIQNDFSVKIFSHVTSNIFPSYSFITNFNFQDWPNNPWSFESLSISTW